MSSLALRRVLGAFVFAAFAVLPAHAQTDAAFAADAEAFAQALIDDLSAVAADTSTETGDREAALRAVLEEAVAAEAMARIVLSPTARASAAEDEIARFDALFPDYIAAAFASQLDGLAERAIVVRETRVLGEGEAVVVSALLDPRGRDAATIEWRLRAVDGAPRLLDVLVERVSRLVSLRAEFSSVAQRRGVEVLLAHMEETLAGPEPAIAEH